MNECAREQVDEAFLAADISDEALEKLATGMAIANNPTVPSAIICIPFEKP